MAATAEIQQALFVHAALSLLVLRAEGKTTECILRRKFTSSPEEVRNSVL